MVKCFLMELLVGTQACDFLLWVSHHLKWAGTSILKVGSPCLATFDSKEDRKEVNPRPQPSYWYTLWAGAEFSIHKNMGQT
jgi:hypothetical protein